MKNATKFFLVTTCFGVAGIFLPLAGLFPEWSPYRYGVSIASAWFFPQLCFSVLLVYAGMFGWGTSNVTVTSASRYRMVAFWIPLAFILALCGMSIWLLFEAPVAKNPAGIFDFVLIGITVFYGIFAFITFILCAYYGLWVHRLRK